MLHTERTVQVIAIQLVLTKPVNGLDLRTEIWVGEAKVTSS